MYLTRIIIGKQLHIVRYMAILVSTTSLTSTYDSLPPICVGTMLI